MSSPTPHVGSISCLKNKKNHEAALQILRRIATMVHPILKSRAWRVGALEEFFPKQGNLLGVNTNQGAKIQIRLRPPDAPESFYPLDDLVGTMLHEMTHIVHGPHNVAFYNLLKELNLEYDRLLDSGYQGQGFDGPGQRLGTSSGRLRNQSVHDDRAAALRAAEKRRKLNEMMLPAGGVRLGGEGVTLSGRKKDSDEINWEQWHRPGELAVMAAERRLKDKVWCGTEDEDRQGQASRSSENPPLKKLLTDAGSPPAATVNTSNTSQHASTSRAASSKRKVSDDLAIGSSVRMLPCGSPF
ncbi:hypothetical protein BGZ73_008830 [Actinomortierella ambigua]|nr:hypothetical protein BGZ73_008830 [Actinomortierella ambigua]